MNQKTLDRMKKANTRGELIVVRHLADKGIKCEICGKDNPTKCVVFLPLIEVQEWETVGPTYLNRENFLIGSTCLKDIERYIGKIPLGYKQT